MAAPERRRGPGGVEEPLAEEQPEEEAGEADEASQQGGCTGGGAPAGTCQAQRSSAARRLGLAEFERRKEQILASLDHSPKGSLDAPILELLSWLNAQQSLVTTSSCSGRIAVFLGSSDPSSSKGGEWLLSCHEAITDAGSAWQSVTDGVRSRCSQGMLATFLLEPFLLHAESADTETAQLVLQCAREAGLRESGLSLGRRRVMVQLRSLALRLEVPLALHGDLLVDRRYFDVLVAMANERLAENARRVARLWDLLRVALASRSSSSEAPEAAVPAPPWVLACPQPAARGIKLALEERGWMDESRKMAPLHTEATPDGGRPGTIGLPVTDEGAAALAALGSRAASAEEGVEEVVPRVLVQEASGAQDPSSMDPAAGLDTAKERRAARVREALRPADLDRLWQRREVEGLQLLRSEALPPKLRPEQQPPKVVGGGAAAAKPHGPSLRDAVATAYAALQRDDSAAWPPLAVVLEELQGGGQPQRRGDATVLPRDGLTGPAFLQLATVAGGAFWEALREALGARLLLRQREIRVGDEFRGSAAERLAGNGDGWVVVPGPKGVRYAFDVTKCMFSEGNAAEKARVAEWPLKGETVLDLYAGIGYWTLPMLVAGADRVLACEWNPDALAALRRGLELLGPECAGRCQVLAGDNRGAETLAAVAGRCHRVLLGLIPTSRDGFATAVAALRDEGGMLHVHWNVASDQEDSTASAVAAELQALFCASRGGTWQCSALRVQRIKWYAPRVRHVRIDIRCERAPAESPAATEPEQPG